MKASLTTDAIKNEVVHTSQPPTQPDPLTSIVERARTEIRSYFRKDWIIPDLEDDPVTPIIRRACEEWEHTIRSGCKVGYMAGLKESQAFIAFLRQQLEQAEEREAAWREAKIQEQNE